MHDNNVSAKPKDPRADTNLDQQVHLLATLLEEIHQVTISFQGRKESADKPTRSEYYNSDIGEKLARVIENAKARKPRLTIREYFNIINNCPKEL